MGPVEIAELIRSLAVLGIAFFFGLGLGMIAGAKLLSWALRKRIEKDNHFTGI